MICIGISDNPPILKSQKQRSEPLIFAASVSLSIKSCQKYVSGSESSFLYFSTSNH